MQHGFLVALLVLAGMAAASDAAASVAPSADDGAADDGASLLDVIMGTGKAPRGERNNNPGNIRASGAPWQGQTGVDPAGFAVFDTPAHGMRALARLLQNYQTVHGLDTVRKVISRYAPSSENNTGAYIAAVAADLGVGPDDPVDLGNRGTLGAMVAAIVRHENGRLIYSQADIAAAVALA